MLKRFIADESGMEMVEWAIVGSVFAIAGVLAWGALAGRVESALTTIGDAIDPGN